MNELLLANIDQTMLRLLMDSDPDYSTSDSPQLRDNVGGSVRADIAAAKHEFVEYQKSASQLATIKEEDNERDNERLSKISELKKKADELLKKYGEHWLTDLKEKIPGLKDVYYFQGEPNYLGFLANQFPSGSFGAAEHAPHARVLELEWTHDKPPTSDFLKQLFSSPLPNSFETLRLRGHWGGQTIVELAKSPWADRVKRLHLAHATGIDADGIRASTSPSFCNIEHLNLSNVDLNTVDAQILKDSFAILPEKLISLDLTHCQITDATAKVLSDIPSFSQLKEIMLLGEQQVSADGIKAVIKSPYLNAKIEFDVENLPGGNAVKVEIDRRLDEHNENNSQSNVTSSPRPSQPLLR